MPFCPQCGTQLPEGAQFCGACGASLAPPTQPPVLAAPQPEKKKKFSPVILVLFLLIAAGAAWYLLSRQAVEGGPGPASVPSSTAPISDGMSDIPNIQDLGNAETLPEGFQRFEDMDREDLAAYLNQMLKEAQADLQKERAKGSKADQEAIREIQKRIESTEQLLRDYGL